MPLDSRMVHDMVIAYEKAERLIEMGWEFDLQYANFNEVEGEPLEYQWWCSFMYFTDDPDDHRMISMQGDGPADAIRKAADVILGEFDGRNTGSRES